MQNIVNKFAQTGVVSHVRKGNALYGEAPEMDFREAMALQAELNSEAEFRNAFGASEEPENVTKTEPEQKLEEVEKESQGDSQPAQNATNGDG